MSRPAQVSTKLMNGSISRKTAEAAVTNVGKKVLKCVAPAGKYSWVLTLWFSSFTVIISTLKRNCLY